MVERSQLWQVKEIVAFLKQQNEKNAFDVASLCKKKLTIFNSHVPTKSDVLQTCSNNFEHYNKPAVSKDVSKRKNESAVAQVLSFIPVEDTLSKSYEIEKQIDDSRYNNTCKHGLNDGSSVTINIHNTAQNGSYSVKATNTQTVIKVDDKSVASRSADSAEISSKSNKTSLQNKRFKSNSTNTSKQLCITEFYNSVKSARSYDNTSSNNLCLPSHKSESSKNLESFILNHIINTDLKEDKTLVNSSHVSAKRADEFLSPEGSSTAKNSNQKSKFTKHAVNKPKSLQKIQLFNSDIQKQDNLKRTVSVDKSQGRKTLDDFCNKIRNDIQLEEKNNFSKLNTFLKFYSTGAIHQENENHKDTNSLPITGCELRTAKRKLEDNKITCDDFFKKIAKKMSNNKSESTISKLDDSEISHDRNKANNLKVIPKSEIRNKNKLENSDSVNLILLALSQTSNCNQNSHVLSTEEKSHSFNFHCIDKFREDKNNKNNCYGNVIQTNKSNFEESSIMDFYNEKESNIEKLYACKSINCDSQNKNSLKELSTTTNNSPVKTSDKQNGNQKLNKSIRLENFIKKIIPITEKKQCKNDNFQKNKFYIKKYRKGKTKIYKMKKLRKKYLETEELDKEFTFDEVLKKMKTGVIKNKLPRYRSGSSISTPSSYITDDDTKSDSLSTGSKELTSPEQRLRKGFNELSKDQSLFYSGNGWEDVTENDKECIKMRIQAIFFQIYEDLKNKKTSYLRHRKQDFGNCVFKDGRLQLKPVAESSWTVISSTAQRSRAKFEIILNILKKIQTLLETDTKLTKRELFYQLKTIINDQRVSDRAINAISCLLDVGMWALNIIAQKGLVFGDLKLLLSSGEMLNCNIPGTLIPQDINDIVEIHSSAYFILVVEKESIFHKLIEEDLPNKLTRPFIMITGKGFPDLNTQLFLRKLWMVMSIPVFILVDADPHGINIMLNYRFGSVNNAHVSHHLAVPNAKWIGVYPSEVINLNITSQPLSEREIKLVNNTLNTPYMEFSSKLVDELKVLLEKKIKASIEGLIKTDSYLSDVYLPNKFFTHNFI